MILRTFPWYRITVPLILLVLASIAMTRLALASPATAPALPRPNVDLQPGEIVEIVISALAKNDQPHANAGIETTFNFASPANRASTGPLDRFVRLVQGPVFGQMINHRDSTLSPVLVKGDKALRMVQIITSDNQTYYYAFRLGLQHEGEYAGMWLTEAVWPMLNPDSEILAL